MTHKRTFEHDAYNNIMAIRIFVQCRSHEMPGSNAEKNSRMANIACQKVWGRDFTEAEGDRLTTRGGYFLYDQLCMLLIDNGPVESEVYDILQFKWNIQEQQLYASKLTSRLLC